MNDSPGTPLEDMGLRRIINASGTMTALGASIMVPEAIAAMAAISPHFVDMDELHKKASEAIVRATGAEAGTVTASTAAGVAVSVAACMTGPDLGRIEQLPDTTGMKNEVVIQLGHMVDFGHPVEQDIRLSGARVRMVGQATQTKIHQLEHALCAETAAALFVVSHHTARFGMIELKEFCEVCHAWGVPVIVDAASEYDLEGFLQDGADLVIYSGHKFLGGPTSGVVAGKIDLVRAVFLQNHGIGRPMKVGKESISGVMAALDAWGRRDHQAIREKERGILDLWASGLKDIPGIETEITPDPTDNPLERLLIRVEAVETRISAWELADRLAAGDPPVVVRTEYVGIGAFELDPCNQKDGQPEITLARLKSELASAGTRNQLPEKTLAEARREKMKKLLSWPGGGK